MSGPLTEEDIERARDLLRRSKGRAFEKCDLCDGRAWFVELATCTMRPCIACRGEGGRWYNVDENGDPVT
jgi:hypothetical protein